MPTYQYKAVDATGKEQSSTIDAGSEKEAGKKIREKGLFPMQGTIREQKTKGRGKKKGFQAHVDQSSYGAGSIIRVQSAQHDVPGQRGLHGNTRGLDVPDFPNHDLVRILPQKGP